MTRYDHCYAEFRNTQKLETEYAFTGWSVVWYHTLHTLTCFQVSSLSYEILWERLMYQIWRVRQRKQRSVLLNGSQLTFLSSVVVAFDCAKSGCAISYNIHGMSQLFQFRSSTITTGGDALCNPPGKQRANWVTLIIQHLKTVQCGLLEQTACPIIIRPSNYNFARIIPICVHKWREKMKNIPKLTFQQLYVESPIHVLNDITTVSNIV